jgi:hypothetical protein
MPLKEVDLVIGFWDDMWVAGNWGTAHLAIRGRIFDSLAIVSIGQSVSSVDF